MKKSLFLLPMLGISMCIPTAYAEENTMPSREEMWEIIQKQQQQINALQQQVQGNGKQIAKTQTKVQQTAKVVENAQDQIAKIEPSAGHETGRGWWNRTSFSHYGELHYNAGDSDSIDLHRFVLGIQHDFTDDVRFMGEVEIEHALSGDGEPGEVEIEQAYVEFDLTEDDAHRAKAGVFLIPVGILNETHEPPSFFGTERNNVEKNIIPTTWWEGGAALSGNIGSSGFSYDLAAHSGLQTPVTGSNAYKIRNGRQKVAEAEATDPAYTARLKWTGYPGVELAVTGQYQSDISQNSGADSDVTATLIETHANIRRGGWGLRALYARWDLDGAAPEAIGRDVQYGWYVEPSYRFEVPFGFNDGYGELGFFARYSEYDNNAGSSDSSTEFEQVDFGLNYWPIDNVVLKADFSIIDGPTSAEDDDILNLGVGWAF